MARGPQRELPGVVRCGDARAPGDNAPDCHPPIDNGLDDFFGPDVHVVHRADPKAAAKALHVAQGRAANQSGRDGEHWVDVHHGRARAAGLLAQVWHVGAPWVAHMAGGRVHYDHRGRLLAAVIDVAPPDYLGMLTDGRALVVEVKRRSGRLMRDRRRADGSEDRDAIEAHQLRDLARAAGTPALVLLVCEFTRARGVIRVAAPWRVVEARWRQVRGGPFGVGPDELSDYALADGCDCYLARFAA